MAACPLINVQSFTLGVSIVQPVTFYHCELSGFPDIEKRTNFLKTNDLTLVSRSKNCLFVSKKLAEKCCVRIILKNNKNAKKNFLGKIHIFDPHRSLIFCQ